MYELIQVSANNYYLDCPAKMGLVKLNDADVVAIDSGSDKDAGKKLLRAACFVPAHAAATEDIAPLARFNIDAVKGVGEKIVSLCAEPIGFDELLKGVFDAYGLQMNLQQYALIGSTLRSYLAWLVKQGRINISIVENRLLWQAV